MDVRHKLQLMSLYFLVSDAQVLLCLPRSTGVGSKYWSHNLTFTTLLANSVEDKLMIFFLFFPEHRI